MSLASRRLDERYERALAYEDEFGSGDLEPAEIEMQTHVRVVGGIHLLMAGGLILAAAIVAITLGGGGLLSGDPKTIGITSGIAFGINDSGQIVGWSDVLAVAGRSAFVWESGTMVDLNDLLIGANDWALLEATAINDQGQIVGTGFLDGVGGNQAFLLTPIPEPSTALLLGGGLLALGAARRRSRPAQ